jgi:hypothetical protein
MKEGDKPETAEENPKKIESATAQGHEVGATPDPLAKDRNKVG